MPRAPTPNPIDIVKQARDNYVKYQDLGEKVGKVNSRATREPEREGLVDELATEVANPGVAAVWRNLGNDERQGFYGALGIEVQRGMQDTETGYKAGLKAHFTPVLKALDEGDLEKYVSGLDPKTLNDAPADVLKKSQKMTEAVKRGDLKPYEQDLQDRNAKNIYDWASGIDGGEEIIKSMAAARVGDLQSEFSKYFITNGAFDKGKAADYVTKVVAQYKEKEQESIRYEVGEKALSD